MPQIDKPISERAGYREEHKPDDIQRDLAALARKHRLIGCVLIEFVGERVGIRSWGVDDEFCKAMDTLGTRVLTDIDDGRHDPQAFGEAFGHQPR